MRNFAALPIVPIVGAFLAKKAVASYAIFEAVHKYGIPRLFRQVAHATRAWGVDAAARREACDMDAQNLSNYLWAAATSVKINQCFVPG